MTERRPLRISTRDLVLPSEEFVESKSFIVGQSGRGKSGLLKKIEEQLVKSKLPFVVFDPAGVAWGLRSSKDGTGPGLPVLVIGGAHGDVRLDRRAGAQTARAIVAANVSCIIDFADEPKAAYREFIRDFCQELYSINDTSRLIVIDEAKEVVPQTIRPDQAPTYDAVERLVRQGRNRGIGVCLVSQRMATVNKDVVTQCGTLFIFGLVGKPDRQTLKEWVDAWATADQLKEFESGLATLDRRECWIWSPQEFKLFKQIRVAEFETFHPDRTHLRKMGLLELKPVTTDVSGIVEKLGAQMERLAKTKDIEASVRKLESEVRKLKQQRDELEHIVIEARNKAPDPRATKRAIDEATAPLKQELTQLRRQHGLYKRTIETARGALMKLDLDEEWISTLEGHGGRETGEPQRKSGAGREPSPPPAAIAIPAAPRPSIREVLPPSTPSWTDIAEGTKLKAGARRMLEVLAAWHPMDLSRSQVAALATMSPNSGTFSDYLSKLRTSGLVEERGDNLRITSAGLAHVGHIKPVAPTHEEIVGAWMPKLKAGQRRMLQVLIEAAPTKISREDLGEKAEIASTSGTFSDYLSFLRRNGLVTADGEGLRASEVLFP